MNEHDAELAASEENLDDTREKLKADLSKDPLTEGSASAASGCSYYCVADAATMLGKSVRTVQRMLRKGELKGRKIVGPNGPTWQVFKSNTLLGNEQEREVEQQQQRINELSAKVDELTAIVNTLLGDLRTHETTSGQIESQVHHIEQKVIELQSVPREIMIMKTSLMATSALTRQTAELQKAYDLLKWRNEGGRDKGRLTEEVSDVRERRPWWQFFARLETP